MTTASKALIEVQQQIIDLLIMKLGSIMILEDCSQEHALFLMCGDSENVYELNLAINNYLTQNKGN
jgi:hypothetical protein